MSEVSLPIGGRTYRVACAEGEEDRVSRLGGVVAEKLASMGNLSGNEAQNLLFAALLLADEVHEGRDAVARSAEEIAAARAAGQPAAEARARAEAELAQLRDAQNAAAEAIESASIRIAELTEALAATEGRCAALEEDNAGLHERLADRGPPSGEPGLPQIELAPALERLAEMLEQCAEKLEGGAAGP